jgi:hypothetical protein
MPGEYEPCTQFYTAWLAAYQNWESQYNEATAMLLDCDRDFNDALDSCVDIPSNPWKTLSCAKRLATYWSCVNRVAAAAAKVAELKTYADTLAGQLWACIQAHTNSRAILPPDPDPTDELQEPSMTFPPMDLTS